MSEFPSNQPKVLMPTLMSNFNYAVNEVLERMNTMGIGEVWDSIKTLYNILPPEIYKKVKDDYEKIIKKLGSVATDSAAYEEIVMGYNNSKMILNEDAVPFFRKCYELLYDGGYLEKNVKVVPIGHE